MTDPHDSILRRCAFDREAAIAEREKREEYGRTPGFSDGAEWQHAQTEPILRALLAECERLREALAWYDNVHRNHWAINLNDLAEIAHNALLAHEAEMRRLGGGE